MNISGCRGKNCHPPFKQLGLDPFKKIVISSNSSGYPFQTIVSHAYTVPNHFHPSRLRWTWQKCEYNYSISIVNYHLMNIKCSRYIFCWIAFFAFIAFDCCYTCFIQDYKWYILNKFPERVMFWPYIVCKYQTLREYTVTLISQSINFACPSYLLPSLSFIRRFRKNNKKLLPGTDLKNKNGCLHIFTAALQLYSRLNLEYSFHVYILSHDLVIFSSSCSPPAITYMFLSDKPEMSIDSSTSMRNNYESFTDFAGKLCCH